MSRNRRLRVEFWQLKQLLSVLTTMDERHFQRLHFSLFVLLRPSIFLKHGHKQWIRMLLRTLAIAIPPIIAKALGAPSLSFADSCVKFHHFNELTCAPWRQSDKSKGFEPWSYQPYCVAPTWDMPNDPEKVFCVYTSTDFNNGTGVSLFTTPKVAQAFSASKAFVNPQSLPEFSLQQREQLYDMIDKPGRGIGLFANQVIKTGAIILIDQPTFVIHRSAYTRFSEDDQEILQWRALLQMPGRGHNLTRGLAKFGKGDEIIDILQTNGFARSYADQQHVQLVPMGARLNHDCRPKWVCGSLQHSLGLSNQVHITGLIQAPWHITSGL